MEIRITDERDPLAMFEGHCKESVQPLGIWLHSSDVQGASPDGLVGEHEIVKVKCPFSAKDGLFAKIDEDTFYLKDHTKLLQETRYRLRRWKISSTPTGRARGLQLSINAVLQLWADLNGMFPNGQEAQPGGTRQSLWCHLDPSSR